MNFPLQTSVLDACPKAADTASVEPNDEIVAWVQRALQGEQDAFTWIADRYQTRLRSLLERRLGNRRCDADDAAQETWSRAFRSLDRYDPRYKFSTWLFTIGLRVATDMMRSRKRRPMLLMDQDNLSALTDPASVGESLHDFSSSDIWDCAQRCLSEPQATALWLRYAEDLSVGEIAVIMRKTQVGVRVLLHRARGQLLQRMDGCPGQDANLDPRSPGT